MYICLGGMNISNYYILTYAEETRELLCWLNQNLIHLLCLGEIISLLTRKGTGMNQVYNACEFSVSEGITDAIHVCDLQCQ